MYHATDENVKTFLSIMDREKSKERIERIKLVKAMEFLARQINNENILINSWLAYGVADSDIDYGDLSVKDTDEIDLDCYIDDDSFSELIDEFLHCMACARKNGGLYAAGVCAGERKK